MTKNKFIKALKIMCVLAPIAYSFIVLTISYIGGAIAISGLTTLPNPPADNGLTDITLQTYANGINATIIQPLGFCFNSLGNTTLGAPIYNMAEWCMSSFFGYDLDTLFEVNEVLGVLFFPMYFLLLIFWYLLVELIFFIPEVILLFIRWCKNLMYSFTRKGGFDA